MTDFIDKIVSCRIPKEIADAEPEYPRPILSAEPYPEITNLAFDAARCRLHLQTHRHSATCWKRLGCDKCRMAYKRMIALNTYITELCAIKDDATGKWVPKRRFPLGINGIEVISPPPPIDDKSPIDALDKRITGFGLASRNALEQYQVEANDLTTSLLRCNTSMQPLIAPSQAKSASCYAAKYLCKNPFELSACLPFLSQPQIQLQIYGSVAEGN